MRKQRNQTTLAILMFAMGVLVGCKSTWTGHHQTWECPQCRTRIVPEKFGDCKESTKKSSINCYSVDYEDVCALPPSGNNCVAAHIKCQHPTVWARWGEFTGGVVRQKRSLQRTSNNVESTIASCKVHYRCPCCGEEFEPQKPEANK